MRVHKIILEARSPVFHALLTSPMREGQEGRVKVGGGQGAGGGALAGGEAPERVHTPTHDAGGGVVAGGEAP